MGRTTILRTIVLAVACAASFVIQAGADTPKPVNVQAGNLTDALEALAKQFGVNVIYTSSELKGLKTQGVSGNLTPREAVAKLLQGTSLRISTDEATGAMMISAAVANKAGADLRQTADMRLAQSAAATAEVPRTETDPPVSPEAKGTPEMLVKGRRTINADIKRSEDDIQPYVIFDREQLRRSMATNVEEFLKTRLPMNASEYSNNQNQTGYGNTSSIDLRGLGTNQTLILVDGRRMPNVNVGYDTNQPDINGIPLAAIERIEVLPSSASGIYGGGATGGVINIVTRQYTGLELQATYGNTFDSDVASRRVDAGVGVALEGGRTQLMMAGSYSMANELTIGERDFMSKGRALMLRNNPGAFYTPVTPPVGYTTNIRSRNGLNLVLDNGTPLNSPRTSVPIGYAGPATDGGAALVANAGRYNLDPSDGVNGAAGIILSTPTVKSITANLRREFGARVDGFIDASWYDNEGYGKYAPIGNTTAVLAADDPLNPFTTPIGAAYPFTYMDYPFTTNSNTQRVTAGVIARLGHDWTASLDYGWGRSRLLASFTSTVSGDPDGPSGPGISLFTALNSGRLNVMRDLNVYPVDLSPYLMPHPNNIFGPAQTESRDANLRLSGPVWQVPAGPVVLSFLAEERRGKASDTFQDSLSSTAVHLVAYFPHMAQTVNSYYLEAQVPLVSARNARPGISALDLQLSVRSDGFRTRSAGPVGAGVTSRDGPLPALSFSTNRGSATTYVAGLRYSPTEDLMFRANVGTGFLPPSISQIVPSAVFVGGSNLIDPKRGSVSTFVGPFNYIFGGNAALAPENSTSLSVGVVLTPRALRGLRLSVDYTSIEKTDEIASLGFQNILDLENYFPGRVTRATLTAQDQALGYTGGVITNMDLSYVNVAGARVGAVDLQIDYSLAATQLGDFNFYAVATRQLKFERQTLLILPFVDSAGFSGGPNKFRANGGFTLDRGGMTFGWNMQYYDSSLVYAATALPAAILTATTNQGSREIPTQLYHDLFARYRFNGSQLLPVALLQNSEISFGIQNVFDRSPPILAITGTTGGYSSLGDPRMRRYAVSFSKSF